MKPLKREFGIHCDFHADPKNCDGAVGATLKEEDIRRICREVKPDFWQVDCKGHPGYASYPSALRNGMPSFSGDPLAVWRKVTREEGVALYLHYSGVLDKRYCQTHPEQTVHHADGSLSENAVRTNGQYADELLIPQLMELAGKYEADGVWVDGECWGSEADFSPETVAQFEQETGIDLKGELPGKPGQPYYEEYRDFCRDLFRRYLRKYIDTVHARYPDFKITSNWGFTDHMPEKVCANVDYLSGDLNPGDSFDSARYCARAVASQNMPWDLMSWNFRSMPGACPGIPKYPAKHPVQVMQEAAAVIAMGGGFQNYITQYPDGAPRMNELIQMKQVAEFVRARQPFCYGGKPVHQAALLLSTYDRNHVSAGLYSRNGYETLVGLTELACDAGHSLEIAGEHVFHEHMQEYPVLLVGGLHCAISPESVQEYLSYAADGGSLLLEGPVACKLFSEAGAPFSLAGDLERDDYFTMDWLHHGRVSGACRVLAENMLPVGWVCPLERDTPETGAYPFAAIVPFGRGRIAVCSASIGEQYYTFRQYLFRELMNALLKRLYDPIVRVESGHGLEVVLLEKDSRRYVQLVNALGNHANPISATEDFIPPVVDIRLSIACPAKPAKILCQPEGCELPFLWKDGRAELSVPRVELHEILEIIQ